MKGKYVGNRPITLMKSDWQDKSMFKKNKWLHVIKFNELLNNNGGLSKNKFEQICAFQHFHVHRCASSSSTQKSCQKVWRCLPDRVQHQHTVWTASWDRPLQLPHLEKLSWELVRRAQRAARYRDVDQ
jgi:hypothetical protein